MNYLELIESKLIEESVLSEKINSWKKSNKKIVFTNGCFDVLHYGHVNYLAKAKDLGDFLIIGLNSDESVKKLKGESRPINNQMARAMLLAALVFVDAVVVFGEETPENLIHRISPDVLVKGGDYKVCDIAGSEFVLSRGGAVEIIQFVDGFSSTKIINNIGAD